MATLADATICKCGNQLLGRILINKTWYVRRSDNSDALSTLITHGAYVDESALDLSTNPPDAKILQTDFYKLGMGELWAPNKENMWNRLKELFRVN